MTTDNEKLAEWGYGELEIKLIETLTTIVAETLKWSVDGGHLTRDDATTLSIAADTIFSAKLQDRPAEEVPGFVFAIMAEWNMSKPEAVIIDYLTSTVADVLYSNPGTMSATAVHAFLMELDRLSAKALKVGSHA